MTVSGLSPLQQVTGMLRIEHIDVADMVDDFRLISSGTRWSNSVTRLHVKDGNLPPQRQWQKGSCWYHRAKEHPGIPGHQIIWRKLLSDGMSAFSARHSGSDRVSDSVAGKIFR